MESLNDEDAMVVRLPVVGIFKVAAAPVWPVVEFGSRFLVDNRQDKVIGRKIW
jgi:hypothetical protein